MNPTKSAQLKNIPLGDIVASPTNPRKFFDEVSISELAQSIKEKGVLQPIVVRQKGAAGKYELVCGERRFRASLIVMQQDPEFNSIPSVIRELTDDESLELQIIENLQRKDVHPMEEANAFKHLIEVKKFSIQDIATRLGKTPRYVAQRVKMNDLIPEFQKAFYENRMNIETSLKLITISKADQLTLWNDDYSDNVSPIEIDKWTLQKFTNKIFDAPFDIEDRYLNKEMGACSSCQFNSANSLLFAEEVKDQAKCMNSQCFQDKCSTSYKIELAWAIQQPEIILVDSGHGADKIAKDLIKKGEKVYDRDAYDLVEKPEMPDREEFEEDLTNGDYRTREEMEEVFNREMKDYQEELIKHDNKINSGKYLKAFVVDGSLKGNYVYVSLNNKKTSAPKQTAADLKQKVENNSVSAEDIKAEIDRIKQNEKRKLELDEEKIHFAISEKFQANKEFLASGKDLAKQELIAFIVALTSEHYTYIGRDIEKICGVKDYAGYQVKLKKELNIMSIDTLKQVLNTAARGLIKYALKPAPCAANQRPDVNGKAEAYRNVAEIWIPKDVIAIQTDQYIERTKRNERVEAKLGKLNLQLKELKKATPGPAEEKKVKAKVVAKPKKQLEAAS